MLSRKEKRSACPQIADVGFGKFHSDKMSERVGYPDIDLGVLDLGQAHPSVVEIMDQCDVKSV
jgi:hypothetical protein